MKHWYRTLAAKVVCFILCIVFLFATVGGIVAAVFLVELGVYSKSRSYMIEDELYSIFRSSVDNIIYDSELQEEVYKNSYSEYNYQNTNLRFNIIDKDGNTVACNLPDDAVYAHEWKYELYLAGEEEDHYFYTVSADEAEKLENVYFVQAYFENGLPISDRYSFVNTAINIAYSMRYAVYIIIAVSFALFITTLVISMCAAARRPHTDDTVPMATDKIPFDVMLVGFTLIFLFLCYIVYDVLYYLDAFYVIGTVVVAILIAASAIFILISIASRVKQGIFIKNTLIYMVIHSVCKAISNFPLIWKSVTALLIVCVFEFYVLISASYQPDVLLTYFTVEKLLLVPFVAYIVLSMRRLQKGGEAIAGGELNYKTDTKTLLWDFKRHGENLNSISEGMSAAVEKRLQSERMKTELITNVSHDIKTPLTSIINYANLIAQQPCEAEKHTEYADVLVRQSVRLKRLLDDLVEASKASSGVIDMDIAQCEANVLITQVAGEFEERCRLSELELMVNSPDDDVFIMADSRRIWRVFENLMSNACKYSLSGSRVYVDLEKKNGEAVFTFRNTSAVPLNLSPDELTERFVRGDMARSTEGNGLGLSIARSLTELQHGKMDITVDGDLFKVVLTFPLA